MLTPKEIKKRYNAINKEFGSSGRNIYICEDNHYTLTRHEQKGFTPMFDVCECGARSRSAMYRVSQKGPVIIMGGVGIIKPDYIKHWVRPSLEWVLKIASEGKNQAYVDHVLKGGLMFKSDLKLK